jgi:hypothetical protein
MSWLGEEKGESERGVRAWRQGTDELREEGGRREC